jgi:molybdopterin synthase catalytic subunit
MNSFVNGPINADLIADTVREVGSLDHAGGHSIFLGQIRNDQSDNGSVTAIEYTSYEEMAEGLIEKICSDVQKKYEVAFIRVRHSLGTVKVGELCLFVFTAAAHRKAAIGACTEIVERIKSEVPIWGKEILGDQSYKWKVNR